MVKELTIIKEIGTGEAEEEPPGCSANSGTVVSDEPSGATGRIRELSGRIPDELWNDWKWQFRNRITTVEELAKFIPLSKSEQVKLKLVVNRYPLSITPHYLSLINPLDTEDPIRKQAIPSFEEIALADMGVEDPLAERRDSAVPGLVHRYPDRVLMVLTNLCPMLCRHCTRKREWRNGVWVRPPHQIEAMLDYIRRHSEVRDVILSGGDPLILSTRNLEQVISGLRRIKHVEIIRIGSRFPVVLPQRIDNELCDMLSEYGPIWLNAHFNHYREITPESAAACDKLLRAGVPVNNQSVLLRGVNDSVQVQRKLCQGLMKIKVRPYYLYLCDEVQGTEHLRTSVETGVQIIEGLRGHTSGLAVPTFVIDLPDGGGKVPIQPNYVLKRNKEELILRNYEGDVFRFRNPKTNGRRINTIKTTDAVRDSGSIKQSVNVSVRKPEGARDENRVSVRS
ncbi:KamA family radical SAM protein [Chloroflexota bacterium]